MISNIDALSMSFMITKMTTISICQWLCCAFQIDVGTVAVITAVSALLIAAEHGPKQRPVEYSSLFEARLLHHSHSKLHVTSN